MVHCYFKSKYSHPSPLPSMFLDTSMNDLEIECESNVDTITYSSNASKHINDEELHEHNDNETTTSSTNDDIIPILPFESENGGKIADYSIPILLTKVDKVNTNDQDDDKTVKIRELQLRLHKRNILLDIVRKAYHRDVLGVKECILEQLQNEREYQEQRPYSKDNGNANENDHCNIQPILSRLSSIPSIDLRHRGFHLFSPQECELRSKPCSECGGYLEVIHRESSRYKSLIRHKEELVMKVKQLEIELQNTKQEVINNNKEITNLREQKEQTDEANKTRILHLENNVADYNELKLLSSHQQEVINNHIDICKEKDKTIQGLEQVKAELVKEKKENAMNRTLINESNEKHELITIQLRDGLFREEQKDKQIREFENTNGSLREEINDLKAKLSEVESQRFHDIAEISSLKSNLSQAKLEYAAAIVEIQTKIKCKEEIISEMKLKLLFANEKISELDDQIKDQKMKADKNHSVMEAEMIRRCREEEIRRITDEGIKTDLLERIDALKVMTSSYIQGLYEQCLAQEIILSRDGPSGQIKPTKMISKKSIPIFDFVLERLEAKIESTQIDWGVLLEKDEDRRKIFGHLNNRSHMNISQIDELIKLIHSRKSTEMHHMKVDYKTAINDINLRRKKEVSTLYEEIKTKDMKYAGLDKSYKEKTAKLSNTTNELNKLTKLMNKKKEHIQELEKRIINFRSKEESLQNDISELKLKLNTAFNDISIKDEEIKDQSEILDQLEGILKNTTDSYLAVTEKERLRLASNTDFGIQVAIVKKDFCQQADFVTPGLGNKTYHIHGKKKLDVNSKVIQF